MGKIKFAVTYISGGLVTLISLTILNFQPENVLIGLIVGGILGGMVSRD